MTCKQIESMVCFITSACRKVEFACVEKEQLTIKAAVTPAMICSDNLFHGAKITALDNGDILSFEL